MGIVCRPILLHNEFLPAIPGKRDWDFRVLGHYDGITIENNIDVGCFCSLQSLFDLCTKYETESAEEMDGEKNTHPFFTQIMFGFHSGSKEEELFWEEVYPFTYLVLLQLEGSEIKEVNDFLNSEQYLKAETSVLKMNVKEKIAIQTYFTLDNSDLLLVIKCQNSRTGARLINNLHQDIGKNHPFKLLNSYSILALDKNMINAEEDFADSEDVIDLLELRLVESGANSISGLFVKLRDEVEVLVRQEMQKKQKKVDERQVAYEIQNRIARKALLGAEDEVILIKELPWNCLIQFFKDETGIFCNSNVCSMAYANAVSCKVMMPIGESDCSDPIENLPEKNNPGKKERKKFCGLLRKNINQIKETDCLEKKTLMLIVNALERFEYSYRNSGKMFSDYNFYQIYFPLYCFIEFLQENEMDPSLRSNSYYRFIKAVMLRTQNFVKPDRLHAQVADFNFQAWGLNPPPLGGTA